MPMYFRDRQDAGRRLAKQLEAFRGTRSVVYALPRGGVPVGITVASLLELPFDLAIASRIAHPYVPDHVVGAMTNNGDVVYDEQEFEKLDSVWLNWAVSFAARDIIRKRSFAGHRRHIPATGRTVIVVDDGMASGLTMRAVLSSIKRERPKQIVVAVPVASPEAIHRMQSVADRVIALDDADLSRGSIAAHYSNYKRLSDRELSLMLQLHDNEKRRSATPKKIVA